LIRENHAVFYVTSAEVVLVVWRRYLRGPFQPRLLNLIEMALDWDEFLKIKSVQRSSPQSEITKERCCQADFSLSCRAKTNRCENLSLSLPLS
jgi:hypothetical protein